MKKHITLFNPLKAATVAGFRGITIGQSFSNVLPMCYPKGKNLRKLFNCKGFQFIKVVPPGIEPGSRVSETRILSVVLWDR